MVSLRSFPGDSILETMLTERAECCVCYLTLYPSLQLKFPLQRDCYSFSSVELASDSVPSLRIYIFGGLWWGIAAWFLLMQSIVQAGSSLTVMAFELLTLLPLPLERWDYKQATVPSSAGMFSFFISFLPFFY